ncbi:MAG: MoaD/ThiS family protein [Actinomycetota bacterium]|jgi:sulfur-carrier protein|nr:MoaD/ThiS family protein [Actinomycetota bacterium]
MSAVTLRLFAGAREAAGTGRHSFDAATVRDVLDQATDAFGSDFAAVLGASRVWLNGEAVEGDQAVADGDEVAVLPPVSGGR